MPPSSTPLVAEGCRKRYATGTTGLAGVDLTVGPGELVALLGPNGSGKSTLVHGVVGLHTLDHDLLLVDDGPADDRAAKHALGFVPDDLPIPLSLTGSEYLRHVERLQRGVDRAWRESLLDHLGLEPHLSKFIADMSHGTRTKLQIVAAVAHRPRLLVMDEPFRGLDPAAVVVIRAIVEVVRRRGCGVLVATHDVLAAEAWFDRVVLLDHGRVVADGSPRTLVADAGVSSLEALVLGAVDAPSPEAVTAALLAHHPTDPTTTGGRP